MCVCLSQSRKLWREGCSGTGPRAPKRASPQSTAQRRHRGSSRNSGHCPRRSSGRTEALAGCVSGSVQASERHGPGWRSWGRGGSREARNVCGRRTGQGPASTGLVLRSPRRATRVISAARRAPAPGAASSPASPAAGRRHLASGCTWSPCISGPLGQASLRLGNTAHTGKPLMPFFPHSALQYAPHFPLGDPPGLRPSDKHRTAPWELTCPPGSRRPSPTPVTQPGAGGGGGHAV